MGGPLLVHGRVAAMEVTLAQRKSYLVIPAIAAARYIEHMLWRAEAADWPDAIIFDLEDSVPVRRKSEARGLLHDSLSRHFEPLDQRASVLVKINGVTTPDFEEDLRLIAELGRRALGIATAKTEQTSELERVFAAMPSGNGRRAPVFPVIETLAGYDNREALCACAGDHGVEHFAFGAGDMSVSLGIDRDYESDLLRFVFCQTVLSARRWKVGIIDSPPRILPKTRDEAYFAKIVRSECEWARRNGAVGKIAIHPKQVRIINEVFGRESQIENARRVLRQFAAVEDTSSLVSEETGEYMGTPSRRAAENLIKRSREP